MLEVSVNINREILLVKVHAVRIKPKGDIKDGEICTYKIMFHNVHVDTIEGPYGCGIKLAIQILEKYDKDRYMLIYLDSLGAAGNPNGSK